MMVFTLAGREPATKMQGEGNTLTPWLAKRSDKGACTQVPTEITLQNS